MSKSEIDEPLRNPFQYIPLHDRATLQILNALIVRGEHNSFDEACVQAFNLADRYLTLRAEFIRSKIR